MMTRVTIGDERVTLVKAADVPDCWSWLLDSDPKRFSIGFSTLRDAIEDAQTALGSSVCIVYHAKEQG